MVTLHSTGISIQGSYGYQLEATADTYLYWDPRSVTWLKFGPGGFHVLDFKSYEFATPMGSFATSLAAGNGLVAPL